MDTIDACPANARKTFNRQNLKDFTSHIKSRGIKEPLILRVGDDGRFQAVVGERRRRAALASGMEYVPARVWQDVSDLEALELQLAIDGQREEVHPLEEADAFQLLHRQHGRTLEQIAKKTGRSVGFIVQRMRLCLLGPVAREAFLAGQISERVALLLTTLPDLSGQDAASRVLVADSKQRGESIPVSAARQYLQQHFMLPLYRAAFSITDAALVAEAGPCSTCQKRTGAQRELFPEANTQDQCMDPPCYQKKVAADWRQRTECTRDCGGLVLQGSESKKMFLPGGALRQETEYVDLAAKVPEDPKGRSYAQLLTGTKLPVPTLARDREGRPHELVPRTAAGDQAPKLAPSLGKDGWKRVAQGAMAAVVQRIEDKGLNEDVALLVVEVLLGCSNGWPLQRRQVSKKPEEVVQYIIGLKYRELLGLIVEAAMSTQMVRPYGYGDTFRALCGQYQIDLDVLEQGELRRNAQEAA